jgi:hypothetical protein
MMNVWQFMTNSFLSDFTSCRWLLPPEISVRSKLSPTGLPNHKSRILIQNVVCLIPKFTFSMNVVSFGVRFDSHEVATQVSANLAGRGPSYFPTSAFNIMGAPVGLHGTKISWGIAVLTVDGSKACGTIGTGERKVAVRAGGSRQELSVSDS